MGLGHKNGGTTILQSPDGIQLVPPALCLVEIDSKGGGEMTRIPVIRNQELAYEFRKTRCYLHFWIAPQTHRSSV